MAHTCTHFFHTVYTYTPPYFIATFPLLGLSLSQMVHVFSVSNTLGPETVVGK